MNSQMNNRFCDNTNCNGGRAFQIRDSMFCSPRCGNIHFNLSRGDEEYWSNEEQEEEEWERKVEEAKQTIDERISRCDEKITRHQENIAVGKENIGKLLLLSSLLPEAVLKPLLQPHLDIVKNDENAIQLYKTEKLIYTTLKNPNFTKRKIFKMFFAKYDELLSNSYDISGNNVRAGNMEEGEYIDYCKRSLVQREYIRKMCCYGYGEEL
tara:strand:- start:808 stop:1437 length:630 start_codon:yes stop_codon:yes gene_type:complete